MWILHLFSFLLPHLMDVQAPSQETAAPPAIGVRVDKEHAEAGLKVDSVVQKGPGEQAGLIKDDVITTINGDTLPSTVEGLTILRKHLKSWAPGQTLQFEVARGADILNLSVEPMDRKNYNTLRTETLAQQLIADVTAVRGLEQKKPVVKDIKSRDELLAFLTKVIDRATLPGDFENMALGLNWHGVLPEVIDIHKLTLDMMSMAIAGFYDPREKKLFLVGSSPDDPHQVKVMRHELVHALQDQNFRLNQMPTEMVIQSDRVQALKSLMEGDAVFTETAVDNLETAKTRNYIWEDNGMMFMGTLAGPPIPAPQKKDASMMYMQNLQRHMLFPYTWGARFVQKLYETGGFDRVDEAYLKWPVSTEQIIHPEKYLGPDFDYPVQIRFDDFLIRFDDESYQVLEYIDYGEFGMGLYLRMLLDEQQYPEVKSLVEGWDGDRAMLVQNKESGLFTFAWAMTWDSKADCERFAKVLSDVVSARVGSSPEGEGPLREWKGQEHRSRLKIFGQDLLLLEQAPLEDEVFENWWNDLRKSIRKDSYDNQPFGQN